MGARRVQQERRPRLLKPNRAPGGSLYRHLVAEYGHEQRVRYAHVAADGERRPKGEHHLALGEFPVAPHTLQVAGKGVDEADFERASVEQPVDLAREGSPQEGRVAEHARPHAHQVFPRHPRGGGRLHTPGRGRAGRPTVRTREQPCGSSGGIGHGGAGLHPSRPGAPPFHSAFPRASSRSFSWSIVRAIIRTSAVPISRRRDTSTGDRPWSSMSRAAA